MAAFDFFLSENEQRAVRWSDKEGVRILKNVMSHLHARAAAEQWRVGGHYGKPFATAYALVARKAAEIAEGR